MSFSRFAAIMRKETRQAIRDPSTLMIAGLLPIMLIFLFGYAVSFDPRQFSVGVVVEQPTGETESFVASLRNTRQSYTGDGRFSPHRERPPGCRGRAWSS